MRVRRRRCRWGSALLVVACSLGSASALAQPEADTPDFTPRNERWQALPSHLYSPMQAADGRIWLSALAPQGVPGLSEFKREVEEAYARPWPITTTGRLLLSEPDGRVWLWFSGDPVLLGYDGKTWIERPLAALPSLDKPARPAGRGAAPRPRWLTAIRAGPRLHFAQTGGIHTLHEGQWSFQALVVEQASYEAGKPPLGQQHAEVSDLLPHPDGASAVAILGGGGNRPSPPVFRWRPDGWSPLATPAPLGREHDLNGAVLPDGRLIVASVGGKPVTLNLAPATPEAAAEFQRCLENLGSASAPVAAAAARRIGELAADALPADLLQSGLDGLKDPQQRQRLEAVLAQAAPTVRLGDHILQTTVGRICRLDGYVFIAGRFADPDGRDLGRALLIIRPGTGKLEADLLQDPVLTRHWHSAHAGPAAAHWLHRGRSVVLSMGNAQPPFIIDLARKPAAATPFPESNCQSIAAGDGKGALLCRLYAPHARAGSVDLMYRHDEPEVRPSIEPNSLDALAPNFALDEQGRLWAVRKDGQRVQFDGSRWNERGSLGTAGADGALIFGRNGEVLVLPRNTPAKGVTFLGDGQVIAAAGLRDLVERHTREVVQAFDARSGRGFLPRDPWDWSGLDHASRSGLAADAEGRVWVLESGQLAIRQGARWLDASAEIAAADKDNRLRGTMLRCLMPLDRGRAFLLANLEPNPSGAVAFLATLQDGKLVLQPAPHADRLPEPDGHDCLYLNVPNTRSTGPGSWSTSGSSTRRLIGDGNAALVAETARFIGVDALGGAWVCPAARAGDSAALLLRDADPPGGLRAPCRAEHAAVFRDRHGDLWVWTFLGLGQHGPAPDAGVEIEFRERSRWRPLLRGEPDSPAAAVYPNSGWVQYSPLGFVATVTRDGAHPQIRYRVHALPLPPDPAATQPAGP